MVLSVIPYPFTCHRSPYVPAVNKTPSFCDVGYRRSCQNVSLISTDPARPPPPPPTPPSTLPKLTLRNHLREILRFSFHNTVLRVWRWAAVRNVPLVTLYQFIMEKKMAPSHYGEKKNMLPRWRGLFSLYMWQRYSFGDPLPRLFKP